MSEKNPTVCIRGSTHVYRVALGCYGSTVQANPPVVMWLFLFPLSNDMSKVEIKTLRSCAGCYTECVQS